MSLKYKSRRNSIRKSISKRYNTKRRKHYIHTKKHHVINKHTRHNRHNLNAIQNYEEHDGREKVTFDTKNKHFDKINLILSNLENKKHGKHGKHGTKKTNYRNYKSGF
jgi:hypothetical protein